MKGMILGMAAAICLMGAAAVGNKWTTEFKTDTKEHVWTQLMRRGIPPGPANLLAQCMVDKAEQEFTQEQMDCIVNKDCPENGIGERHARECIEGFRAAKPTPPKATTNL